MAVPYQNYLLTMFNDREDRKIQRKRIRDCCDPLDVPDVEFQRLWRINKPMAQYLISRLAADLEPRNSSGLPAHLKVLCSVQFLANGGYQRQIGQDHTVCHSQTANSRFLGQFTDSIYRRLFAEWVHFPGTEAARSTVAAGFQNKYRVPDVLGVIDCTHVAIFPPSGPQYKNPQYKNRRKGVHTINVQLVADSECRILSVNARYPGRVHDSFIWKHSNIRAEMKRLLDNRIGNFFLLGDSGYPLEPWLLTPILHAQNAREQNFTTWHCQVRNGIERTNGYLKGSFRCLGSDRALHYAPEKASEIIYACCIVYNIMKHFGVPLEEGEMGENLDAVEPAPIPPAGLLRQAQLRRSNIVETYFNAQKEF